MNKTFLVAKNVLVSDLGEIGSGTGPGVESKGVSFSLKHETPSIPEHTR